MEKQQPQKDKVKGGETVKPVAEKIVIQPSVKKKAAPFFRKIDWITFAVTSFLVFCGYYYTLAPDCTLEDCGELAVASYYAGVPHPPGYPVWTIYTWLFTVLLPVSNIAFRVAVASAFAGALGCGLIGMMVSRGSSLIIEAFDELKGLPKKWENLICFFTGYVAAMLMGFNGFMWSQSVIVEVYSLSVLSLTLVLCFLFRWMYAPEEKKYLYLAFFMFGICFTTHQTLLLAAVGLEIAVAAANPRLGRDLFILNSICYFAGLILASKGDISSFKHPIDPSRPSMVFYIFNLIGIFSILIAAWLIIKTKKVFTEWKTILIGIVLYCAGAGFYFYMPIASMTNPPMNWGYPRTVEGFKHALTRGQYEKANPTDIFNDPARFWQQLIMYLEGAVDEFTLVYLFLGLIPVFYFGYKVYREGGQKYIIWLLTAIGAKLVLFSLMLLAQKSVSLSNFLPVIGMFTAAAFLAVCFITMMIAYYYLQKPERAWIIGLIAIYFCLAVLLLIMLNPSPDRQSRELTRVFFTSSHVLVCMGIGYGLTIAISYIYNNYTKARVPALVGTMIATAIALYVLLVVRSNPEGFDVAIEQPLFNLIPSKDPLVRFTALYAFLLAGFSTAMFLFARSKAPATAMIVLLGLMPIKSILSHWSDNEQRGHLFGYWFGHDMFRPPFKNEKGEWSYSSEERKRLLEKGAKIYPEMERDAVLFGGTDPGRFNPTYMIFCESFIPPSKKPRDPDFDRRDVYLITQNALADATYLNYIRAHYNRSAQKDPPFFSELFKPLGFLDSIFMPLGDKVEKRRRTYTSYFKESDFTDIQSLKKKLKEDKPLSKYIVSNLSPETLKLMDSSDERTFKKSLAKDLNKLLEKELIYETNRFAGIQLTKRTQRFIAQNPQSHTRIRLNRILLEEAFPTEIKKSLGGVYPDLEIITPSPADSQKAFQDYIEDAQRRLAAGQLRPGEDVRIEGGRVQVSGQVAVMSINALLTKVIFDKNPDHEFYVEESFPLDWMYPYLTPYGIIMKINRNPVPEITEDIIERDHKFWSEYSERLIGNWITYDTPISNICAFAEKVYLHRDYEGFKGDRKFIRDDNAQKAFSKLRSAIGGVYAWRYLNPRNEEERKRVLREAEFAFKQSFAFCPFSPEAVFRYVNLILTMGDPSRFDDALLIAKTCKKLDPYNAQVEDLIHKLEKWKEESATAQKTKAQLSTLQKEFFAEPTNAKKAFELAQAYLYNQDTNKAGEILEFLLNQPNIDGSTVISIAQAFMQLQQITRLEKALQKLTALNPQSPEAWFDLAGIQAILAKPSNALESLKKAISLSDERLDKKLSTNDLRSSLKTDPRFNVLRGNPEFEKLAAPR
jgi:tetratricopeptide (TPR) repeat protein/4-amino-4-deoxy-L-arabinose transferase-like glycosyltransferase